MPLADAHIHLFDPGFVGVWPDACRRVTPSEVALYDEFTRLHAIEAALVIGYEGEAWAKGNNRYIADLARRYAWLYPVAFVHDVRGLNVPMLDAFADQGFLGISLYLFNASEGDSGEDAAATRLADTHPTVWQWLAERRWLISVNSSGELWRGWQAILARRPDLRLLISHLGLPPPLASAPTPEEVHENLAAVLALAAAPHVHVKLSAFYALSNPSYAYPHTVCWPYVQALLGAFGPQRLLWGSDFTPALESVSFPQSVHVLETMPFLSPADRRSITHDNLTALLRDTQKSASQVNQSARKQETRS